jgi:hypothetical protein
MIKFDKYSNDHNRIKMFLGFVIIVLLLLLSCGGNGGSLFVVVRDLSACTGPDKRGIPQGISKSFSSGEDIFACGRLETSQPIAFSVSWYHDGKYLGREILTQSTGYFYSPLQEVTNQIETGDYELNIVIGKSDVYSTHFRVESIDN